jgi:hypothetical protein
VQYEDDNTTYRYYFTFKDSSGCGMYPTSQTKLEAGGKDIITNIEISKSKNGKITNVTELEK